MVVSMILALSTAPGLLGTQEAIRQGQSKERREEHRARRCNLIVTCVKTSSKSREINGRRVILTNDKLYIDTGPLDGSEDGEPWGHPFCGYYLPYPDTEYEGLVSSITDEAPIMNWIYVDRETYECKYGVRAAAQPNLTGPFDCTRQERRMTFEGWEGFVAVEEGPGIWAVYFDREDNGLRQKIIPGTRVLEIELTRKEQPWKKDKEAREVDQTTQHTTAEMPSTTEEQQAEAEKTNAAAGAASGQQDAALDNELEPAMIPLPVSPAPKSSKAEATAPEAPYNEGTSPTGSFSRSRSPTFTFPGDETVGSPTDPHGGSDCPSNVAQVSTSVPSNDAGYRSPYRSPHPLSNVQSDIAWDIRPASSTIPAATVHAPAHEERRFSMDESRTGDLGRQAERRGQGRREDARERPNIEHPSSKRKTTMSDEKAPKMKSTSPIKKLFMRVTRMDSSKRRSAR
ncbi:hypothetical protein BDY21DRAFT_361394 [Lineolata rhizophorae]|uniref:Uncharacterized protein n=1 Tax=Lineolata rhizophorae TaxID=578093 RepID=A0A6A6P979_9PEZI|nr:hypothetical protein BDY21DRAFT_361394 [Lineolata rhizophorae]